MKYFSLVGSNEGGIKLGRTWFRVSNLNHVVKEGWRRHQGPITNAMNRSLIDQTPIDLSTQSGRELLYRLAKKEGAA